MYAEEILQLALFEFTQNDNSKTMMHLSSLSITVPLLFVYSTVIHFFHFTHQALVATGKSPRGPGGHERFSEVYLLTVVCLRHYIALRILFV